ncbi:MAG: 3-dehydroquinate synthase [Lentisphaeria bacterium]|nr:3-dehydroquinate synthase [Lentisphaeria bacterium]
MKKCVIPVVLPDNRSYNITIGDGATEALRELPVKGGRLFVYDDRTMELFSGSFAGIAGGHHSFGRGEADKRMEKVVGICQAALREKLDRGGVMVAVGGGVTGDMTGFAAGIYLRGIRCIQVPTSLLAMVDSSVGGKTAVDLPEGKNLIGIFHQPQMVLIEPAFLRTLPEKEWRCGMAEVIKMAAGFDPEFFEFLAGKGSALAGYETFVPFTVKTIARCCELKAMVVAQDEKESAGGVRAHLNFGHTFGHGIESAADFQLSHGECVAIGMVIAGFAALKRGVWSECEQQHLTAVLQNAALPVTPPESLTFADVLPAMTRDKKNRGGRITLVLPEKIGKLFTATDVSVEELQHCWQLAGGRI